MHPLSPRGRTGGLILFGFTLACGGKPGAGEAGGQAQVQTAAQTQPAAGAPLAVPAPVEIQAVELPSGPGSTSPNLGLGEADLHLVWIDTSEVPTLMHSSRPLDAGLDGAWTEARPVVRSPELLVNWADVPAVAETHEGRIVVAWPEHHGPDHAAGYGVRVSAEGDDGSFGPAWSPDDVRIGPESGFVAFARSEDTLRMFWLDGRSLGGEHGHGHGGGTMSLRSVEIDGEGQPRGPSEVHDTRTCECCKLGAAAVGGQLLAAYRDRSEAEIRDTYLAGPGLPPHPVGADNWRLTGCPVNGPAVVASGDQALVAWYTGADELGAALLAHGRPGRAFSTPQRFDLGAPSGRIDLTALADGSALVSWLELDETTPGRARLLARRVTAEGSGGSLGPAFEVAELGAGRDWGFAKTAALGDSVVWVFPRPSGEDGPAVLFGRAAAL